MATTNDNFQAVKNVLRTIRLVTVELRDRSLAGAVASTTLISYQRGLKSMNSDLQALLADPALAALSDAQTQATGRDVLAEVTAMSAAVTTTIQWIIDNFPTSGGFLLERSWDAQGNLVDRTFATAQLATFRTRLNALIAAITP